MPKPIPTEADLIQEESIWRERHANNEIAPTDNCYLSGAYLLRLLLRTAPPPFLAPPPITKD